MTRAHASRTLADGARVSAIGIGTQAWGDAQLGFNARFRERELELAFERASERLDGLFVDTAEVYGIKSARFEQSAEQIVGGAPRGRARRDGKCEWGLKCLLCRGRTWSWVVGCV